MALNDVSINLDSVRSDWVSAKSKRQCRYYDDSQKIIIIKKIQRVNVFCFCFFAYVNCFVKVLVETNLNISNEFKFSDVYRSVKYTGSLAKFT